MTNIVGRGDNVSDKQLAIETVSNFLRDGNKRVLLVKGYDNDAKIRVVLRCLNQEFEKGVIRTSSMADVPDHINKAFNKNILPNSVKSTVNYKIGRMVVNISSYVTHTKSNPTGNQETFTLLYPVQTVLNNPKRYNDFLNELKKINSKKIIIITTNEWSIEEWDIEEHMDEVFFYNVENDNPEIMRNLRDNGAI